MTKSEFIKEVEDELSVSCALPVQIPTKEIERLMRRALKWFYDHYEDSMEEGFLMIKEDVLKSTSFRQQRTLTLPEDVYSVFGVHETNRGGLSKYYNDPDMSVERFVLQDAYPGLIGQDLFYYTASQSFISTIRSLFLHTVKFDFNKNSHKFKILGEVPNNSIALEVYKKLPESNMYDDDFYLRYVTAEAKRQLSRILGTFQFDLIGGAQINYDIIRSEGQEELQQVKDEINDWEGADWFFVVN